MRAELDQDYGALRDGVGAYWLDRDALRVEGPDALAFLDGQLSQDLKPLGVGDWVDALLLQPQGKVVALLRATRTGEQAYVLDVDAGFGDAVAERLKRFLLRTKATIEADNDWRVLAIGWPGDNRLAVGTDVEIGDDHRLVHRDAYEAARIEAGVPVMGREIDDDTIPASATGVVERAVSFSKGCYTGQELVARIDSRGGNVPRRLFGVELDGPDVPEPGTQLRDANGDVVATVTSAAVSPRTGGTVALAYVPRKVQPPVEIAGGLIRPLPLA